MQLHVAAASTIDVLTRQGMRSHRAKAHVNLITDNYHNYHN
jgi:hypothetical protein